jgi:uncharacterized membrane protein
MRLNDRILASSAYIFGIPALYIVLTDLRKKEFIGGHGAQALVLWIVYFVTFFAIRSLVNLAWLIRYIPYLDWMETLAVVIMGAYAVYCGFRSFRGEAFRIPR